MTDMSDAEKAFAPDSLFQREFRRIVAERQAERARCDEQIVRSLLGRWVSELAPAVAFDKQGNVIGLTMADAPIGSMPFVMSMD